MNSKLLIGCLLGIVLVAVSVTCFRQKKHSQIVSSNQNLTGISVKPDLFPFAIDIARAERDKYFGPPVLYNPDDKTMNLMRQIMLGLAKAMDNPKHPCNPLVTAKAKIVGMNIKPLNHGDKTYTMWVSDGETTCGLELTHFEGWGGATLNGDFFQEFYLRDMAGGFGYNSKSDADQILLPDKKRFWKQDIGEATYDMVVDALGQDFLKNTLSQEYSGFFVSDAYNASYIDGGREYNFFTPNIVEAILKRTDMPQANPSDTYYTEKFDVHFQAEPTNSLLAFKVVHVSANNNGFAPKGNTAVRLR